MRRDASDRTPIRGPRLGRHGPARTRPCDRPAARRRARRRAAVRRAGLRLPARRRGPARRRRGGRGAARQLRPARRGRRGRGVLPRALRAARRRARACRPRGARTTPATCRPGRATCGSAPARSLRSAARRGWRPATRRAIRPRRSSTGWRRRPVAARCSAWPSATGCSCARCCGSRARRRPRTACARGLSWREDASNADPAYARNRARANLVPALRELHPSAERNVVRTAELLRDEAAVLDEVVETALAGRDEIAVAQLAALPVALARLVVRRLAEDAAGRLCARAPGRLDEILDARRRRARSRRRRTRRRQRRRAARRVDAAGALGACVRGQPRRLR